MTLNEFRLATGRTIRHVNFIDVVIILNASLERGRSFFCYVTWINWTHSQKQRIDIEEIEIKKEDIQHYSFVHPEENKGLA
jgi:hypothetical protein